MAQDTKTYCTAGGVTIHRTSEDLTVDGAVEPLIDALNSRRGVLLTSNYEYTGRYSRWDVGFIDPPLVITSRGRQFDFNALNLRGGVLLRGIAKTLSRVECIQDLNVAEGSISGTIAVSNEAFAEEMRSRQPSTFSVLRAVIETFASPEDPHFGLYGAFGYDLAFQFEPIRQRLARRPGASDLVLYLPDRLIVVDHRLEKAARYDYEFEINKESTRELPRGGTAVEYAGADRVEQSCDHLPGQYAECVRTAREAFRRGDLFEVVPGQSFFEPCVDPPSEVFRRLRELNPAPYSFLMHLDEREYLVGASPEMYVRVKGRRVETCPISGTIARGADAIEDAAQILRLLNSGKDESELTMCTDVDRNDKSRICEPGSVRVLARRQIEIYSRLIHTVDHVEGILREPFDALDAFLAHTWAVTVTGAPKAWAMQFIEDHEKTARGWYGGAVGHIGFDGNLNTGLTIRTIQINNGIAEVRAGATLLYDSVPEEEERETRLKAAAFIQAIGSVRRPLSTAAAAATRAHTGRRILLVDHQDSFVHTLANYLRQTGWEVITLRSGFPASALDAFKPDLVVLSPGPGAPRDFAVSKTIASAIERGLAVFGVCLGLQGMVEYFGGTLDQLEYPMHGKSSRIRVLGGRMFDTLPLEFDAGRYHSLYANREALPPVLQVTAESDDGIVMAIEHATLPMAAVQFHPESILTLGNDIGLRLIRNVAKLA